MTIRTLDDADLQSKRVLLRVDLNVPVSDGQVTDTTRIERIKPTIVELQKKRAKIILLSHFGRPKGRPVTEFSLKQVLKPLENILGCQVKFAEDCIGDKAHSVISGMSDGDVVLLENTRFHAGEEKNDVAFCQELAKNGDIYVNDAFSAAHRAHASTEGLAKLLPSYAGRAMQQELAALDKGLGNPAQPVIALVGGAKVSTKIELLNNLVEKVEALVIGGGMANTFLAATGIAVGKSVCEHDLGDIARNILAKAKSLKCAILLPVDAVVGSRFEANTPIHNFGIDTIPFDGMVLDLGELSIARINAAIDEASTLIWNGPLGAFELSPFEHATVAVAHHVAKLTKAQKLVSIAGGGDTVAALNKAGVANDFTYISTAGGAFLEWMEGKTLPGVAALEN